MKTKELLNILQKNKDRFFHSKELEKLLDINSKELRKIIHNLRVSSHPIISGLSGYKYTTNKLEIINCYNSLRKRSKSIYYASEGLLNYFVENNIPIKKNEIDLITIN